MLCFCSAFGSDTTPCVIVRDTGSGTTRPAQLATQSSTTWSQTRLMSSVSSPTLRMSPECGASRSFTTSAQGAQMVCFNVSFFYNIVHPTPTKTVVLATAISSTKFLWKVMLIRIIKIHANVFMWKIITCINVVQRQNVCVFPRPSS